VQAESSQTDEKERIILACYFCSEMDALFDRSP